MTSTHRKHPHVCNEPNALAPKASRHQGDAPGRPDTKVNHS